MKEIKRTKARLGSGAGMAAYESEMFIVTHWYLQRGKQTEVMFGNISRSVSVRLCGHVNFQSDATCLAAFSGRDILRIIKQSYNNGIADGKHELKSAFRTLIR